MPMRKYVEPCGCTTKVDRDGAYIEFCPQHAAAPAMYKALLEAKGSAEFFSDGYALRKIAAALALADKDKEKYGIEYDQNQQANNAIPPNKRRSIH